MSKLLKGITAAAAAAILSLGVVGVIGTASSYPKRITNEWASFEWGPGYANTTNQTPYSRLVCASVVVYKDGTGDYVTADYQNKVVGFNQTVSASVNYSSNGYNFVCGGSIYGDASSHSPVMWSDNFKV